MIQAGDINAMQRAVAVRFSHNGKTYEWVVQWIQDNDDLLSHERNYHGCVSLQLHTGDGLNDLPRSTPVEVLQTYA